MLIISAQLSHYYHILLSDQAMTENVQNSQNWFTYEPNTHNFGPSDKHRFLYELNELIGYIFISSFLQVNFYNLNFCL